MAFDYASLRQDVHAVLADMGRTISYHVVTAGAYSASASEASVTVASHAVVAVDDDYGSRAFIPGSLIQVGDRRVVLSALKDGAVLPFTPAAGDRVVVDGVTLTVIAVERQVQPGGVPVVWVLQVRR
jgi:hypothetical protein